MAQPCQNSATARPIADRIRELPHRMRFVTGAEQVEISACIHRDEGGELPRQRRLRMTSTGPDLPSFHSF